MKTCNLCGGSVAGRRCMRCGMPYYDDDGIRYHLNETAVRHEQHSPGNRVFSQYMEPRKLAERKSMQKGNKSKPVGTSYKKSDFPVTPHRAKANENKVSGGSVAILIVAILWIISVIMGSN